MRISDWSSDVCSSDLVTHDRYFLDNVVNWILELDRGRYFVYEGNYSTYLEKKGKRLEQESREDAGRQKAIKDELEWIRQSPKARQAKRSEEHTSELQSLMRISYAVFCLKKKNKHKKKQYTMKNSDNNEHTTTRETNNT